MDAQKITNENLAGESDLCKAVKLLEENGFFVVHADWLNKNGTALVIKAYPRRTVSVEVRPDVDVAHKNL